MWADCDRAGVSDQMINYKFLSSICLCFDSEQKCHEFIADDWLYLSLSVPKTNSHKQKVRSHVKNLNKEFDFRKAFRACWFYSKSEVTIGSLTQVSYQHFSRLVSIGVCRVHLCFFAGVAVCVCYLAVAVCESWEQWVASAS